MYFVFLQKDLQGEGIFGIHQFEKGWKFTFYIFWRKRERRILRAPMSKTDILSLFNMGNNIEYGENLWIGNGEVCEWKRANAEANQGSRLKNHVLNRAGRMWLTKSLDLLGYSTVCGGWVPSSDRVCILLRNEKKVIWDTLEVILSYTRSLKMTSDRSRATTALVVISYCVTAKRRTTSARHWF